MSSERKVIVFLCGARDYHAMDWYKSCRSLLLDCEVRILTDLIGGEGFKVLVTDEDPVDRLVVIDKFLFRRPTAAGDLWRNLIKLLLLPVQVFLLKRHVRNSKPTPVYHAHSMYYIWLSWLAGVRFIGTPQGSDILVKPFRSRAYKLLSRHALKAASAITVDSEAMAKGVWEVAGVHAHVIQNGVDVEAIVAAEGCGASLPFDRDLVISIRGMAPLYRISEVVSGRNRSVSFSNRGISFIYPFVDNSYKQEVARLMIEEDRDLGRVTRKEMYKLFRRALLVLSTPLSDSSPRSVYESIFCGAPVAVAYNKYIESLPACMRSRLIVVDLSKPDWFDVAINKAKEISQVAYVPSLAAREGLDQVRSFKALSNLYFR